MWQGVYGTLVDNVWCCVWLELTVSKYDDAKSLQRRGWEGSRHTRLFVGCWSTLPRCAGGAGDTTIDCSSQINYYAVSSLVITSVIQVSEWISISVLSQSPLLSCPPLPTTLSPCLSSLLLSIPFPFSFSLFSLWLPHPHRTFCSFHWLSARLPLYLLPPLCNNRRKCNFIVDWFKT